LNIRPNSRQIPKHREYTASKLYNDLMYAYIQSVSTEITDGYRHTDSKLLSWVNLSKELDITPITAKKRFLGLQELQLIGVKKRGKYDVFPIAREYASLIPLDVVEKIVRESIPHSMSIYVDMMNRYIANREEGFRFTLTSVKENIGISTNTYNNSEVVTGALEGLDRLGLIEYWQGNIFEGEQWVMINRVNKVNNTII
jgi:DNA-binding transcriptional regulator YhcF (GntR family)